MNSYKILLILLTVLIGEVVNDACGTSESYLFSSCTYGDNQECAAESYWTGTQCITEKCGSEAKIVENGGCIDSSLLCSEGSYWSGISCITTPCGTEAKLVIGDYCFYGTGSNATLCKNYWSGEKCLKRCGETSSEKNLTTSEDCF